MAVITISATNIGPELISGIPQLVSLETNIPSTIFFTLDGSVPTIASQVYLGAITMPTNATVNLRALAISGIDSGSLNIVFKPDVTDLKYPWRGDATFGAGIVVDAYNVANDFYDGYGLDAYRIANLPVRFTDVDVPRFDIKLSRTGAGGEGYGTLLSVGFVSPKNTISVEASTPNGNNIFFNPRSLYITIDGRDGYQDQIHDGYMIINRPHTGTADPLRYLQGRMLYERQPYISGGHVKTHYNYKTGIAVSYYFDHNETRWIKSIQNFNVLAVPMGLGLRRSVGGPLVFKWIHNKRSMI